ncbi:MAG TPA: hypothetical protein PLZ57_04605 [Pseudobdellovibrionaceae bacterium]|nr:hypothetical protein [Pseudobdellovibrionaceae bacterium]
MPFQPPTLARTETHLAESGRMKSLRAASAPLESEQAASAVSATSTEIGDETRDALRRLSQLIRHQAQAQAKVSHGEGEEVDAVNRQVLEGRDAQAASDRARFLSENLQTRWRLQRGISRYKSEEQRGKKSKLSRARDPKWADEEALASEADANEAANVLRIGDDPAGHAERFADDDAGSSLEMQSESSSGAEAETHSQLSDKTEDHRGPHVPSSLAKRRYYRAA